MTHTDEPRGTYISNAALIMGVSRRVGKYIIETHAYRTLSLSLEILTF